MYHFATTLIAGIVVTVLVSGIEKRRPLHARRRRSA
jgi:hypothetical protein